MSTRRRRAANGRSSIYEDESGVWNGWVSMGHDENDNPVRRHVRGKTCRDVSERVAELEKQRSDTVGLAASNAKATVGEWFDEWLTIIKRTRKPRTWSTYDSLIRTHCEQLRKTSMHRLTVRQIDDLLDHVATTVSPRRASNLHRTLRACLNLAMKRGRLPANPCRYAAVPRVIEHEIEPLTLTEVRLLLAAAAEVRNTARWSVALALGLRQGEALALRWSDIDLDAATLQVRRQVQRLGWEHGCRETKPDHRGASCPLRHGGGLVFEETKSRAGRRVVALPGQLVSQLREQRRSQAVERLAAGPAWIEQDLVFAQPDGKPIDGRADSRAWKALLKKAGVRDARLHDARHTNATLLLAQGVDGRVVMAILGWSQAVLLTRYQHVIDSMRYEAAAKVGAAIWG